MDKTMVGKRIAEKIKKNQKFYMLSVSIGLSKTICIQNLNYRMDWMDPMNVRLWLWKPSKTAP